MAEISIRERIARKIQSMVGNADHVTSTQRRHDRNMSLQDGAAVITTGEETLVGEQVTVLTKDLMVRVGAKVMQPQGASETTDERVTQLLASIVEQVMQDRKLNDGEPLAITVWPDRAGPLRPAAAGAAATGARVLFRARYQHQIDDVGIGPGITQLTE